jgi:uncharacterized phage-associated protein
MLRFAFDEKKALEALVFVANEWPGVTAFYAAKVVFFADKEHMNKYGRPVFGDRYIAMDNGPVPSAIYDWFKGNLDRMGDPNGIASSIELNRDGRYVTAKASREPAMEFLSPSDVVAIRNAIAFCRQHSVGELSRISHDEPAWQRTELNAEMDPALMIEGDHREEMIEVAKEFAAYGVG